MSHDPIRLLFDECISRPGMDKLVEFLGPKKLAGILVQHLLERELQGSRDEDWIPRLRDEDWTVISADGGKTPNKRRGKNLPLLCGEYVLTLVVLSSEVHKRNTADKIRTLLSVWDEIVAIAADPTLKGKRYNLEPLNPENRGIGRLVERKTRRPPTQT